RVQVQRRRVEILLDDRRAAHVGRERPRRLNILGRRNEGRSRRIRFDYRGGGQTILSQARGKDETRDKRGPSSYQHQQHSRSARLALACESTVKIVGISSQL